MTDLSKDASRAVTEHASRHIRLHIAVCDELVEDIALVIQSESAVEIPPQEAADRARALLDGINAELAKRPVPVPAPRVPPVSPLALDGNPMKLEDEA